MKVTVFKQFWDKIPTYLDIDYVLDAIKSGKIKDKIIEIREADPSERKRLKEALPCILFSGEFSERLDSKIIKHSGIICLDFDKYESKEELASFKEQLKEDPIVYAIFDSPSGNGIKVLVKTTAKVQNHRRHFQALRDHFDNPNFDSSCINESRVCFMSYDENIHVNKDSEVFTKLYTPKDTETHLAEDSVVNGLFKWWDSRYGFVEGQRNRNIFILAAAFNEFGVSEMNALNFLSQFERQDFTGREIKNCVESAYKKSHLHNTKSFDKDTVDTYEVPKKEDVKFNISDIFTKSFVDVNKPLVKQPIAISIGEYAYKQTFFPLSFGTYGNFSCIVGASKSKKSFFKSMLVSSYLGGDSFQFTTPMRGHKDREMFVLDIDTEQGLYDAQRVFKRVTEMIGKNSEYYKPFALRPYEPKERLEFVEWLIYESDYRDNIGLLSIDGLVDLAYDFNDLKESSALIQKIMKWTDDKQFHLSTVIHSNPNTTKPSGHLGTTILKKAETICNIEKDNDMSLATFPFTRSMGIPDLRFAVNSDAIPYFIDCIPKRQEPKIEVDTPF